MKIAKKIIFVVMCVLLVTAAILGYAVLDNALGLVMSMLAPASTPPSSSPTTPSIPSTVSTPPTSSIHECEFTVKGKTYEPSCDSLGYTVYTCACGKEDYRDYVSSLGHIYSENTVVPPTCTEGGWTERTCSRCHITERFDLTEKIDHKFREGKNTNNYEQRICDVCNLIEQFSTESGPIWKMEIFTKEPVADYKHLQILLDLNGGEEEYTYDIYIGIPDASPEFDYLNGKLMLYCTMGEESKEYSLPKDGTVLTVLPDGTQSTEAPIPAEPAE